MLIPHNVIARRKPLDGDFHCIAGSAVAIAVVTVFGNLAPKLQVVFIYPANAKGHLLPAIVNGEGAALREAYPQW